MKKIYVFGAAALALCAISCNKENNGPDTPNGKPEITVAKDALVASFRKRDSRYCSAYTC